MAAKVRYSKAAIDGLLLAAITIILTLVPQVAGSKLVSVLAWIVKLGATMYALYYFMKKNTQLNTAEGITTTYGDAFKYGFVVSLFSVILIAVFTYINLFFTDMDAVVAQVEQQMPAYASSGINQEAMSWVLNHMQLVSMLSVLIWYAIWSAIASAIFAGPTKSPSPFNNTEN